MTVHCAIYSRTATETAGVRGSNSIEAQRDFVQLLRESRCEMDTLGDDVAETFEAEVRSRAGIEHRESAHVAG